MKKYFDKKMHRLIFINTEANSKFWDLHWDKYDLQRVIKSVQLNQFVSNSTKRYLPKGSKILEGGCGLGQNVWSLSKNGYDAYGIDYAVETVEKVNTAVPELKISRDDVRALRFKDNFFDGYWSIGVIEHFYNGFDIIASEMKRVIRPGGYLFLTFPCISKFREQKIRKGKYEIWKENKGEVENFYQFALSATRVESEFADIGFKLVQKKSIAGFKGFKDEIESKFIKRPLQKLYDTNNYVCKAITWGLGQILVSYTGHCKFLIFKNMQ